MNGVVKQSLERRPKLPEENAAVISAARFKAWAASALL